MYFIFQAQTCHLAANVDITISNMLGNTDLGRAQNSNFSGKRIMGGGAE